MGLSQDRQQRGKNRLRQHGKGLGRSRGCVRALSQAQKSSAQTGRKGFGQGLNKGLQNTKNWATLMRAPALPCEQKAGGRRRVEGKERSGTWKTAEELQRALGRK